MDFGTGRQNAQKALSLLSRPPDWYFFHETDLTPFPVYCLSCLGRPLISITEDQPSKTEPSYVQLQHCTAIMEEYFVFLPGFICSVLFGNSHLYYVLFHFPDCFCFQENINTLCHHISFLSSTGGIPPWASTTSLLYSSLLSSDLGESKPSW